MEQIQSLSKQASKQVEVIGSLDSTFESTNRIYSADGVAPTVCTYCGGNQEAKILEVKKLEQCIVAMRGRNPENPSDRTPGAPTEQRLEPNEQGICNTLTSVAKDNLVLEIKKGVDERYHNFLYEIDGELYLIRIRKLIPRECWRLMSFTDEDFDKAASVNSNTQLYKQAGNSLVRCVMAAIMSQLNIGNIKPWNEMSDAERRNL